MLPVFIVIPMSSVFREPMFLHALHRNAEVATRAVHALQAIEDRQERNGEIVQRLIDNFIRLEERKL